MTETVHLNLPVIEAAQAQKHVTHNEALTVLDALVMLAVLDRDLDAPPALPAEGDRYLVRAPGAGAFAGKDNQIAQYRDGSWSFHAPAAGWTCYIEDEATLVAWNGSAWQAIAGSGWGDPITELQDLLQFGLGTTADATNPFAARLNNVLWTAKPVAEGGDGSLRYKLSKESAAKTLSFLFQDNYSGRAEIGLTGDDDFHFKVSADGSAWADALIIDKASAAARFTAGVCLAGIVSPAQITSDQNNYNPAGLAGANLVRLSSDANRVITGLTGGTNGRVVLVHNSGAQPIILKDESASSSAANRFALTADLTLAPDEVALLQYDGTSSRWRAVAASGRLRFDTTQALSAAAKNQLYANLGITDPVSDVFHKADPWSVAFTKTGAGTISVRAGTTIGLGGVLYSFAAATAVQMPTLTAGTDYAIYICNDGTLRADASFSYPSGFSASTSRKIGGFHYAPGGNAAAQAGGDSTPAINPYSLWDLKFRPACLDPRGMALVAGAVWVDIYLLCRNHIVNGTSKYGDYIATSGAKPKIPLEFGGDGSAAYSTCDWWVVSEILNSYGKRLMRYDEFCAAAYGVTEASAAGSHPVYAGLDYVRTSKWGIMQATGNINVFGFDLREHWNGSDAATQNDIAGGRGQLYGYGSIIAPLFGGYYGSSVYAGSRCINLVSAITTALSTVGARGCCAHVCHV